MVDTHDFPEIAFVRVLTGAGPYAQGSTLTIAFVAPGLARVASHDEPKDLPSAPNGSLVPEMVSARVVRGAPPYEVGTSLALWFVDPAFARVQATPVAGESIPAAVVEASVPASRPAVESTNAKPAGAERMSPETISAILRASDARTMRPAEKPAPSGGVRVRLDWNRDRVRRFVQVVDKLFTVDRLGWYRHVFAMRLLVPDAVTCPDVKTDGEALRHLQALRAASIETLGRPLLAAFMPSFTVTPEWLDSLDKPAAARALAGLREALLPHSNEAALNKLDRESGWTITALRRTELAAASASSVESLLPLFIPWESTEKALTDALGDYRAALVDMFGQTTQSADPVRLTLMAEPNHTLDDRLVRLSRAVNETFGGLAVA